MTVPTVLVVDDDSTITMIICTYLRSMFKDRNLEFISENSAEAAISHLAIYDNIKFVISDFNMRGKSGLEMLEWMRENSQDIPVIIMTGYNDEWLKERVAELGAKFFLKPFKLIHLAEEVERSLK